jgi:hypothetical protein
MEEDIGESGLRKVLGRLGGNRPKVNPRQQEVQRSDADRSGEKNRFLAPFREELRQIEEKYNAHIRNWAATGFPSRDEKVNLEEQIYYDEEEGTLHIRGFGDVDVGGLRATRVSLEFKDTNLQNITVGDMSPRYNLQIDNDVITGVTYSDSEGENEFLIRRKNENEETPEGYETVGKYIVRGDSSRMVEHESSVRYFPDNEGNYYIQFGINSGEIEKVARDGTSRVFLEQKLGDGDAQEK